MVTDKAVSLLSQVVIYNKYANFLPTEGRRQTWDECVTEVMDMHIRKYPALEGEIRASFAYVFDKKVMPSMRSIQYGGWPTEVNPCRIYNCAYTTIDTAFVFAEIFFALLSGTGVGYSIRSRHIKKLSPIVQPQGERRFLVGDSIEGWADSVRQLTYAYMRGKERPRFDYRGIRPAGSPIKSGGTTSGYDKLKLAHENIEAVLKQAIGRRLTELECHDMICYMADCVLAGGRRDSAMISLFDLSSTDMISCKSDFDVESYNIVGEYVRHDDFGITVEYVLSKDQTANPNRYGNTGVAYISLKYGDWDKDNLINNGKISWYYVHPQRARANNSIALRRGQVSKDSFMDVFKFTEQYGEPAFVWTNDDDAGFNPCAEISLNPNQFCNLTSVVVADLDTQEELNARVKAASFIGTLQAGYTDFHYLRHIWKETTEREALLGISMTGVASGAVLKLDLKEAAQVGVDENVRVSGIIGINRAARVTTMKPEGTGTLAMGVVGSGVHAAHGKFMVRTVRINKSEPLYKYLSAVMPSFVETDIQNDTKAVVSFPLKAPDGVIDRSEPLQQFLDRIKLFSVDWVGSGHVTGVNTHNVSATISVKPDEWKFVAEWMWENRDIYSGLSLLPYSGGNYKQAPFSEIDEETYNQMMSNFPSGVDLTSISESKDVINHVSDSIACAGGACEIN